MAFESWYKSILATKLNPWDTTLTVAVPPTITAGRIYLKSWTQEEWMSFTWLDGNVLTGLTRQLSRTQIPAVSEGSGYTWTAGTTIRIVAMHDQITWGNMDTSNFAPSSWSWESITLTGTTYTRQIAPTSDFTVNCSNLIPWMTYILIVDTWVAYALNLWTGIENPFAESMELTTNKKTYVVFLATGSSDAIIWSARTAE